MGLSGELNAEKHYEEKGKDREDPTREPREKRFGVHFGSEGLHLLVDSCRCDSANSSIVGDGRNAIRTLGDITGSRRETQASQKITQTGRRRKIFRPGPS